MTELDNEFTGQYQRMNKIFSERFEKADGVGAYIEEMENTPDAESAAVPFWHEDYKTLRTVYSVYKKLSEDSSAAVCTNEEMYMFYSFYSRLFIGNDSLSVLEKIRSGEYGKVDIEKLNIGLTPVEDVSAGKYKDLPFEVKLIIALLAIGLISLAVFIIVYLYIN